MTETGIGSSREESESLRAFRAAGNADGIRLNVATFWLFAQRVAWGEAKPEEVAFMSKMFDLVDGMGDWLSGTNDYMSGNDAVICSVPSMGGRMGAFYVKNDGDCSEEA